MTTVRTFYFFWKSLHCIFVKTSTSAHSAGFLCLHLQIRRKKAKSYLPFEENLKLTMKMINKNILQLANWCILLRRIYNLFTKNKFLFFFPKHACIFFKSNKFIINLREVSNNFQATFLGTIFYVSYCKNNLKLLVLTLFMPGRAVQREIFLNRRHIKNILSLPLTLYDFEFLCIYKRINIK